LAGGIEKKGIFSSTSLVEGQVLSYSARLGRKMFDGRLNEEVLSSTMVIIR